MECHLFRRALAFSYAPIMLAAAAISLSGCSGSEPQGRIVPQADYSGCDFLPEVGEKATLDNISRDEIALSPLFAKKYDRADLLGVSTASALETTHYVKSLSVALYKIPRPAEPKSSKPKVNKTCTTYYSLEMPRQQLKDKWDRFSRGNTSKGQLAGLYFEDCEGDCDEQKTVRPTILIDEQADRWTLVHEMMHHNFNVQRKADTSQPSTQKLIIAINDLTQRMSELRSSYQGAPSLEGLRAMAETTHELSQILYVGMVRSAFEEVAVEGLLIDEWAAGRLKYVSAVSARSAVWYMEFSRDRGLEAFNELRQVYLDFIREEANSQGWSDVARKTSETNRFINETFQATAELIDRARAKVPKSGQDVDPSSSSKINPILLALTHASHLDHHAEGDALLEAWKSALQNSNLLNR